MSISLDQMITYNMCGGYITLVYSVKHPAETKTKNRQMCRCVDIEMEMWRYGYVEMGRCGHVEMCKCGAVKMCRCRCGDVKM